MASDGKRYRSEANGGGGGWQGRRVGDAESGMSEAANQQAQDWVRKSRKRRQSASSFEAAQAECFDCAGYPEYIFPGKESSLANLREFF